MLYSNAPNRVSFSIHTENVADPNKLEVRCVVGDMIFEAGYESGEWVSHIDLTGTKLENASSCPFKIEVILEKSILTPVDTSINLIKDEKPKPIITIPEIKAVKAGTEHDVKISKPNILTTMGEPDKTVVKPSVKLPEWTKVTEEVAPTVQSVETPKFSGIADRLSVLKEMSKKG